MTPEEQKIYELAKKHVDSGDSGELDIELLAERLEYKVTVSTIRAVVRKFATELNIEESAVKVCPIASCVNILDFTALTNNLCDQCGTDYCETGDEPKERFVYNISGERSRDIEWMIVVHGFNTDGKWQEEFSWQLANKLKYSAPIFIYKYGIVRLGILFHHKHCHLAKELGRRIQRAIKFAKSNGIDAKPDIIVHSFGSKLFVTMLEMPEFNDIKFGRVITTGSIIQPNYDWKTVISIGRIEGLLNHIGGKDGAVPFAQFFIPKTGPSGKIGFTDGAVSNVMSEGYGHSTHLLAPKLFENLSKGGLWDKFLTWPIEMFKTSIKGGIMDVKWNPYPRIICWTGNLFVIALLTVFISFLVMCMTVGFICLVNFLLR